jgi:hypothetical protein
MQSDDEFCGEPARCVSPSASDAEFAGDSVCVLAAPNGKGRGRPALSADPCMYLVSTSTKSGLWPELSQPGESGDDSASGILLVQWELVGDEDIIQLDGTANEMANRVRKHARGDLFGFLVYTVVDYVYLQKDGNLPQTDCQAHSVLGQMYQLRAWKNCGGDHIDVGSVGDVVLRWQRENGRALNLLSLEIHPGLASRVYSNTKTLHCIGVTGRIKPDRFLSGARPSRFQLHEFRQRRPLDPQPKMQLGGRELRGWANQVPFHRVIKWLRATSNLKDVKKSQETSDAFAEIMCEGGPETVQELKLRVPKLNPEIIRRARVRLDAVAMLMFGAFFAKENPDNITIYIYVDGSPQYRGYELYATSIDFVVSQQPGEAPFVRRFLLPVVSLGREYLDVTGKALALLWQLYLMVGASGLQPLLARVRGVLTDSGTEKYLIELPDILDIFWNLIGETPPKAYVATLHLFPQALRISGWKHVFDLLIRKGLTTLSWFPSAITKIKGLVKFLRDVSLTEALIKHCKSEKLDGLAAVVGKLSLPGFAHWRWTTLHDCCKGLAPALSSLAANFDAQWFPGMRDRVLLTTVVCALGDQVFLDVHFPFVQWVCRWITRISSWVGGCPCHPPSNSEPCLYRGRRMEEAYAYACARLRDGLQEAQEWAPSRWGGEASLADLLGCVRLMFDYGAERMKYLDEIPYLLVRLQHPGVAARCLQQFASAPVQQHDRVSIHFLGNDSDLCQDVKAILADGSNVSAKLMLEIDSLKMASLDDAINEGPTPRQGKYRSVQRMPVGHGQLHL